jgi:D-alanine-D-alanine ligase
MRVAVLAGGRSSEHDVSLSSAAAVRAGLAQAGHEVLAIEIGRDGVWRVGQRQIDVTPGRGLLGADVVFPALHGRFGEDGAVQGLLETLDVAYVGAGLETSVLCMDKVMFKRLMSAAGVPQVAHAGVGAERWRAAPEQVLEEAAALGLPVFVKPSRMGSSVGIVKVGEPDALAGAIDAAFEFDELVIVEAAAAGLEVECGVLGVPAAPRSAARASEPGEISFAGDFYDYEAKYQPDGMRLLIPARISSRARERVMELAVATFDAVACDGLARVDFFVDGENVLVNELNTMPGFTPTSVYAKLLEASGVSYAALLERLCRLGIERHTELRRYRH